MPTDDVQLTFVPSEANVAYSSDDGVFVGNGKLGVLTSLSSNIDVNRVVTTCDVTFNQGLYRPNVIDVFNPCRIALYNLEGQDVVVDNTSNLLLMENGCYSSSYVMSNVQDGSVMNVTSKIYAMRHLPYTMLQSIEISPVVLGGGSGGCDLFHEVYTRENIRSENVVYDHTYNTLAGDKVLHQFYGYGTTFDNIEVAFASMYMFDDGYGDLASNDSRPQCKAIGSARPYIGTRNNSAYFMFQLSNLQVGVPVKLHVLTTLMTNQDFPDPRVECRAVASSLAGARGGNTRATISWLLGKHVDAWSSLWKSKAQIIPRSDASMDDFASISTMNKLLNLALYNIYASVRENYNVDLGGGMPVIDLNGNFLYDGDLWLVPLLLVIKPLMAKNIIEFRHKTLLTAQQLASAYGYQGAKYPYVDDVLGYRNNLYYLDSPEMHLFNSALVAINAWNYFRISKDSEWLRERGYKILKDVAAFLVDVAKQDAEGSYAWYFEKTLALSSAGSERDNTFTNNVCKLALRYAIEASYELRVEPVSKWGEVYEGIEISRYASSEVAGQVMKRDAASVVGDTYDILEVLYTFCPMLWEEERGRNTDVSVFSNIAKANLEFYKSRVGTETDAGRPSNLALEAIVAGVHMSTNMSYVGEFVSALQAFIDNVVYGPWYYMKHEDRGVIPRAQRGGLAVMTKNSLYSNALFMAMFVQGVAQLRVQGGVNESRFHYADLKLAGAPATALPPSWNMLSLVGCGMPGADQKNLDTRQSDGSAGNIMNFPHPPDFEIYTP